LEILQKHHKREDFCIFASMYIFVNDQCSANSQVNSQLRDILGHCIVNFVFSLVIQAYKVKILYC